MNGDGVVDACEINSCVVAGENAWRASNCPVYNTLYCECPFDSMECMGNWDCESIYDVATYFLATYDSNTDGVINSADEIDAAHLELINSMCDFDNDAEIDACEAHACIVVIENEWRLE